MLASAKLLFRLEGPKLLADFAEAIRTKPQPPYGRPARASGKTERQLRQVPEDDNLTLYGPPHIQALVTGRGPTRGNGASATPLREVLEQWAKDKRITLSPGTTYKQFGFLLARKIHREGTALYRMGQPSTIFSDILTPQRLGLLKARIAAGEMVAVASELKHVLSS